MIHELSLIKLSALELVRQKSWLIPLEIYLSLQKFRLDLAFCCVGISTHLVIFTALVSFGLPIALGCSCKLQESVYN